MRNGNADVASLDVDELVAAAIAEQDDSDASARIVGELQRRGTPDVLAAAERLTRNGAARERLLGAWILGQIAYPDAGVEPFRSVRARAVVRLLELLHEDPDPEVVRAAISGLGLLSALGALDDVLAFATDPDAETRRAVAGAFPGLTGWQTVLTDLDAAEAERVVSALASLSEDEDGDVRDWALFALGRQYELDSPELRDLFARHLDDPDEGARAEAIVGLARRRDARALPAVLAALGPDVATDVALEAAAHLGDDRLLPRLEELAQAGWEDESSLAEAMRTCDPRQRARWDELGSALAATLRAELEAQLGDVPVTVEAGREPLELSPTLAGTWRRADGTEATLWYDLPALVEGRLDNDLAGAADAFRQDIADAAA